MYPKESADWAADTRDSGDAQTEIKSRSKPSLLIERQIVGMRARLDELVQRSLLDEEQTQVLELTLQELFNALEELQVTIEELNGQNDRLLEAQEEIDLQRIRYQQLFQYAPEGYLVTDQVGIIVEANQAAASILGVTSQILVGKPLVVFIKKPDSQDFLRLLSQLGKIDSTDIRNGSLQLQMRSRPSKDFAAELSGSRMLGSRGEIVGVTWFLRDVSERTKVQSVILEAEERFRALVENSGDAIAVLDPLGVTTYASPSVTNVLGFDADEFIGRNMIDKLVHPDDLERVHQLISESIATPNRVVHGEARVQHSDGSWKLLAGTLINRIGDPAVRGIIANFRDVSDLRKAEHERIAAERKYREFLEAVPAISYSCASGEIESFTYVSPQVESVLGFSPEYWIQHPRLWTELLHPDDVESAIQARMSHLSTGAPLSSEYRLKARDGRIVWIHEEASLSGIPPVSQGIMLDVSERREAEKSESDRLVESTERLILEHERLLSIDEMKDTLVDAVAHDLKTPLAVILGVALTLESKADALPKEAQQLLISRLSQQSRRLSSLLSDLLDFRRIEGGAILEPRRSPVDMANLVAKVLADLDIREHIVEVDVANAVGVVDRPKVERILENLLVNAMKHTPVDSRIWISVKQQGDGVSITVEDDGNGVPDDLKSHVFDAYRQGDQASPNGSGFGLSLVRSFAELHGGRAWVEDRPEGGSSFRVFLPSESSTTP